MSFLSFLFRKHPAAVAIFILALAGIVAFSAGFVRNAVYFSDPAHRNQTIEGWMTPRYVGHSWGLPVPVVRDALRLTEPMKRDGTPMTLSEIARIQAVPLAELQARIEAARADMDLERSQNRHHDPQPDDAKRVEQ